MSQELEGWSLRSRPVVVGLFGFLTGLLLLVTGAGLLYNRWYAAETRPDPKPFPAPVLELTDTAPTDIHQAAPLRPPQGIDHAMAATAAQGDALWRQR